MIWLNFARDLKSTASRLVSVMLITAIAVLVYTGLGGILSNADQISQTYFDTQNVSDYWITGTSLDRGDCRTLAELEGVTGVQPRVVWNATQRGDDGRTLLLYAVPEDYAINTPYLVSGAFPSSDREMLLSDVFAQANGIRVGDPYELTLAGTDQFLRLTVSGLIKSPECLYHANATTPLPELERYGFAYLNEGALQGLMGVNRYNQVCLTTDAAVSDDALRQAVNDRLGERVVNILALKDNRAAYSLMEMKNNLAPVIRLFPILFFLCAILLMVSNMSRLIENARSTVGTFKALGYRDGTILRYYLLHAVLVVLVGFPLGAIPSKYLAAIIVRTLATGCDLPAYTVVQDYAAWGQALGITALCCVGSAWLVARSQLREGPAQCMRPKPPKSTKPVLLERVPLLWRRLGFNQKYIIRSTLRNKPRMLTCVAGIAFCMGLVLVAFALQDSVGHYARALADNQNQYDVLVDLGEGVSQGQYSRLARLSGVEGVELEMGTACWLYSQDRLTTAALTVAEDRVSLRLYDPYAAGPQTLPADGLILSRDTAEALGVGVGDTVRLRFAGDPRYETLRVVEVNRCVSGAYLGRSLWRSLGRAYVPTGAYIAAGDREALAAELERYDFVDAWQTRETVTGAVVEQLSSAALVAYILILFGGGLACVVIYNLGIMSFFEQIRSLATLMVLGFHDREIRRLQLSENIIFALGGICAGVPIGIGLSYAIVSVLRDIPLVVATKPLSYALSCTVTMLFALGVNGVIGRKMKDIDMLGALKSVE